VCFGDNVTTARPVSNRFLDPVTGLIPLKNAN
jgi:hypothetical protein